MNYGPVILLLTSKYEHAPCINDSDFDFAIAQIQGINENIHQPTLIIFGEKDPFM